MADLIIYSLAVWRLCRIMIYENGPGLILERIRLLAGAWRDDMGLLQSNDGSLGDLVTCLFCLSVWFGVITSLIVGKGLLYGFAISGVVIFIDSVYYRVKYKVTER